MLVEAIERAENGLIDADLGGGVVKLRVARPGQGRSGGFRTMVALVVNTRAIYLLGFAKNNLANVGSSTVADLKKLAGYLLTQDDTIIDRLIESGELRELGR